MRLHELCAVLLAFSLMSGLLVCPTMTKLSQAVEQNTEKFSEKNLEFIGLDAEYHTQEEIREYYKNHPVQYKEAEYSQRPSVT